MLVLKDNYVYMNNMGDFNHGLQCISSILDIFDTALIPSIFLISAAGSKLQSCMKDALAGLISVENTKNDRFAAKSKIKLGKLIPLLDYNGILQHLN